MEYPATSASNNWVGKRKSGNIDYSFCGRLLSRVECGCLGGDEHVHDLGPDCDASSGSGVLRVLDRPNGKKPRTIAFERIAA